MLDGLVSTLGPLDLGVLLIPGSSDPSGPAVDPLLETAAMDVAVIMWGGTTDDPMLGALRRRGTPTVLVEGQPAPDVASVGIDDRGGMRQATEHLLELGHTRIATVTLPFDRCRSEGLVAADQLDHLDWEITRRRLAGVTDAGVDARWRSGRPPRRWSSTAAPPGPPCCPARTARPPIACQSDLLASGVVLAARELGLRVPEDVSVSGFDGLDLPWLAPDVLTTVGAAARREGCRRRARRRGLPVRRGTVDARAAGRRCGSGRRQGRRPTRQLASREADQRLRLAEHPDTVHRDREVDARRPGLGVEGADDGGRPRWSPHPGPGTGTGRVKRTW